MINLARLSELLGYLYDMQGLQCSVHELDGKEIYSSKARSRYCDLICAAKGGYQRCLVCDKEGIAEAIKRKKPYQYRCHAGAIDTAIPVLLSGEAVAVILFGQLLDDSDIEEQWAKAQSQVAWYPNQEELHQAFYSLPRMSRREIKACYELVNACVSETRMELLTTLNDSENAQKLELYIANHYAQPLNLSGIGKALNMSVSRLCALAAGITPGMTVMRLVTARRIAAAQSLLKDSASPIRDIASRVGIPDYNYFTKVFKKEVGQTPSAWRKQQQQQQKYLNQQVNSQFEQQ
ncbi:MAG: helix-turn-helix domain-containing protein [Clostridiales bacterium]|nr:helix-turn-helix domain-containing protein [Clostridiales bacterium]